MNGFFLNRYKYFFKYSWFDLIAKELRGTSLQLFIIILVFSIILTIFLPAPILLTSKNLAELQIKPNNLCLNISPPVFSTFKEDDNKLQGILSNLQSQYQIDWEFVRVLNVDLRLPSKNKTRSIRGRALSSGSLSLNGEPMLIPERETFNRKMLDKKASSDRLPIVVCPDFFSYLEEFNLQFHAQEFRQYLLNSPNANEWAGLNKVNLFKEGGKFVFELIFSSSVKNIPDNSKATVGFEGYYANQKLEEELGPFQIFRRSCVFKSRVDFSHKDKKDDRFNLFSKRLDASRDAPWGIKFKGMGGEDLIECQIVGVLSEAQNDGAVFYGLDSDFLEKINDFANNRSKTSFIELERIDFITFNKLARTNSLIKTALELPNNRLLVETHDGESQNKDWWRENVIKPMSLDENLVDWRIKRQNAIGKNADIIGLSLFAKSVKDLGKIEKDFLARYKGDEVIGSPRIVNPEVIRQVEAIERSADQYSFVLSIILSGISILIIFVLIVLFTVRLERKMGEIALLKMIGLGEWDLAFIYLAQAILLGLSGSLIGVGLGIFFLVGCSICLDFGSPNLIQIGLRICISNLILLLFVVIATFFGSQKVRKGSPAIWINSSN